MKPGLTKHEIKNLLDYIVKANTEQLLAIQTTIESEIFERENRILPNFFNEKPVSLEL